MQVIVREAKEGLAPPGASLSPCPVHGLLLQAKAGGEEELRLKAKKAEEEEGEDKEEEDKEEEEELEMTECSEDIITYQPVAKNKFRLSKVNHSRIFNGTLPKLESLEFSLIKICNKMIFYFDQIIISDVGKRWWTFQSRGSVSSSGIWKYCIVSSDRSSLCYVVLLYIQQTTHFLNFHSVYWFFL